MQIETFDADTSDWIIKSDYQIDEMEVEVKEECLKIMALYQPVAVDLRFLVAIIKINNDLERIGDQAVNIAQRIKTITKPFSPRVLLARIRAVLRRKGAQNFAKGNLTQRLPMPSTRETASLAKAIKYSGENTQIIITSEKTLTDISINIQDHGIGISNGHIPRLFERFYRVDKARSRKQGDTGLGLAIVKHTINAHGGHVTVESLRDKGSTFTIHLPLSDPS